MESSGRFLWCIRTSWTRLLKGGRRESRLGILWLTKILNWTHLPILQSLTLKTVTRRCLVLWVDKIHLPLEDTLTDPVEDTSNLGVGTSTNLKSISTGRVSRKAHCDYCSFQSCSSSELESHLLEEHETEEKPLSCSDCPMKFSFKQTFSIHCRLRHGPSDGRKRKRAKYTRTKCDICGELVKDWKTHKNISHPGSGQYLFECEPCGMVFQTYAKLILHCRRHAATKTGLKCVLCPSPEKTKPVLSLWDGLPRHIDEVHGIPDLQLKCDFPNCAQIFYFRVHLKGRKAKVHEKKYRCSECDKCFKAATNLKTHVSEVHLKDNRGRKCDLCPASFSGRDPLLLHKIRGHNNPKLKCELCPSPGKFFTSFRGFSSHRQVFHPEKDEKKYKCRLCSKEWPTSQQRYAHEKTHNTTKDFSCETCGFATTTSKNLGAHRATHKPENAFPCSECQKQFPTKQRLEVHMSSHSSEKPFQCDVCGGSFKQNLGLMRHKEKQHAVDKGNC